MTHVSCDRHVAGAGWLQGRTGCTGTGVTWPLRHGLSAVRMDVFVQGSTLIVLAGCLNPNTITSSFCRCQCVPTNNREAEWRLREGAPLPIEAELKKMVTPDMAAQYEALIAGVPKGRGCCACV